MSEKPQDIEELRKKLLEMAERSTGGIFWIPQNEGDYLFGKVIQERVIKLQMRGEEREVKAVDIKSFDDDMVYTVTLTHKVLARLWESYDVQPGDIVLILYKGAVRGVDGEVKYHLYGLGVEKAAKVPEFYLEEHKKEKAPETEAKIEVKEVSAPPKPLPQPTPPPAPPPPPAPRSQASLEEVVTKVEVSSDEVARAADLTLSMLEFYGSISKSDLQQMINSAGFKVNVDDVIKYLGDKIRVEGESIEIAK